MTVVDTVLRPAPGSVHATEWGLVELARAGDTDAFAGLYRLHRDGVHRFILWRVKKVWVADDLTAEVFVRALKSLHRVRYSGLGYGAWLTTIARHLVADYFKSAPVTRTTLIGGEAWLVDDLIDSDAVEVESADVEAARRELADAVRRAVAQLPPNQRQIVELRFFHDMDVAETAEAVGSSPGAVKAAQWRAIQKLREHGGLEAWR